MEHSNTIGIILRRAKKFNMTPRIGVSQVGERWCERRAERTREYYKNLKKS